MTKISSRSQATATYESDSDSDQGGEPSGSRQSSPKLASLSADAWLGALPPLPSRKRRASDASAVAGSSYRAPINLLHDFSEESTSGEREPLAKRLCFIGNGLNPQNLMGTLKELDKVFMARVPSEDGSSRWTKHSEITLDDEAKTKIFMPGNAGGGSSRKTGWDKTLGGKQFYFDAKCVVDKNSKAYLYDGDWHRKKPHSDATNTSSTGGGGSSWKNTPAVVIQDSMPSQPSGSQGAGGGDSLGMEQLSLQGKDRASSTNYNNPRTADSGYLEAPKVRSSQSSGPSSGTAAGVSGFDTPTRASGRDSSPGVLYVIQSPFPDTYPDVKIYLSALKHIKDKHPNEYEKHLETILKTIEAPSKIYQSAKVGSLVLVSRLKSSKGDYLIVPIKLWPGNETEAPESIMSSAYFGRRKKLGKLIWEAK